VVLGVPGEVVAGVSQYVFDVPMDYPGPEISKNRLWHGGDRRAGMNRIAAEWKDRLTDSVHYLMKDRELTAAQLAAVHVEVSGHFWNKRHSIDLQNVMEIACDAVQDGLGVNDRNFSTSTRRAEYGAVIPEILVKVTVKTKEEKA
jgi:hypothetical protein